MSGAGSVLAGRARTAVILGSGLSGAIPGGEILEEVPYGAIEGLPSPGVEGHPGIVRLIAAPRRNLLVFSGRSHLYEGGGPGHGGSCVRAAAGLGCAEIVLVHAAGSLARSLAPSSWMVPEGIVSLAWRGAGGPGEAPGRPSARPVICTGLRARIEDAVMRAGEQFAGGVLYWTAGPAYETPAEGRAAARAGAAAAAMSPLPELSEAASLGLRAACLSRITNYTPNVVPSRTGHEDVVASGLKGSRSLSRILGLL